MDSPSVLLEKLKIKPKAALPVNITVQLKKQNNDEAEKEQPVIINAKIVDKPELAIDRKAILEKLQGLIGVQERFPLTQKLPKSIEITIEQPKSQSVVKRKLKKIKLREKGTKDEMVSKDNEGKIIEKITITRKRITDKPCTYIKESPVKSLQIGDTILEKRLSKPKKPILLKRSEYYMNNREIFINFINSLFDPYKTEVLKEEDNVSCDKKGKKTFSLLTHQKIVRDYLNLITPYRGLLLYHGLGSGKTCSSIAIAEGMKTEKQVIIMTPASLRRNYIEQLKECGDSLYKKKQFWEFIPIERDNDEIVNALSYILSLDPVKIKKQGGAWLVNIKKKPNYDLLSGAERASLDEQINEMIRCKYKFINYNGLRKQHLKDLTFDFTRNPFDNKVVVIDEVHNFVSRIVNKMSKTTSSKKKSKNSETVSIMLYNYIMNAKNAKFVFLSGTPIINYPNEIAILYNMLRGKINTWYFKLNVNQGRKLDQETLQKIFSKIPILDYMEYKPASTSLVVTRNPFGFYDVLSRSKEYKGIKIGERGELTDKQFIEMITKILKKHDIDIITSSIREESYKALPDNYENFQSYFINADNNDMKNTDLFKRRVLGLTSYLSDMDKLMPQYDKNKNFHVVEIPMSDFQFGVYEEARQVERRLDEQNKKKRRKQKATKEDIYEDTASTYRIFSRAFCNFVFPRPEIMRPMPREGENIETVIQETADEDLLDATSVDQKLENPDGRYNIDEEEKLKELKEEESDMTYDTRIKEALRLLKENSSKFLSPTGLQTYSPKFLNILENILDPDHKGLHLIYSQFRTLEGIGILKLVLEANGFTQFRIKQESGNWVLDISPSEKGKPMFALYTGTESPEEKEIIRNVFNSTWTVVPASLVEQIKQISSDNFYGEIIKVLMITASGAEGIDLKNIRYVHITEPYWHPVRMQQVIGRARRICSHKDLSKELQTVEVFLYLMKFSEEQLKSDISIELRLKDKAKDITNKTPLTSDQALYEISTIKEDINQQILTAVKESAIDCSLHSKEGDKEQLQCFTFGSISPNKFAYSPSISDEDYDKVAAINKKKVTWKAVSVTIDGKKYALNKENGFVYDLDSYKRKNPVQVGKLTKDPETDEMVFKFI